MIFWVQWKSMLDFFSKKFQCMPMVAILLFTAGCCIEIIDINFSAIQATAEHPMMFYLSIDSKFDKFDDGKNKIVNCIFVPDELTDLKIELNGTVFDKTKNGDRYNYVIFAHALKNGVDINGVNEKDKYDSVVNDMKKFTDVACEIRQMSYIGPSGLIAKFSFPVSSLLEAKKTSKKYF